MLKALSKRPHIDLIILTLILLLAGSLLTLMHNRFLTVVNHDAAIFCILAQSILKGNYLLVSEPFPQPYFTFPPLLSAQLAGLMFLFHNTDTQAMQSIFKSYIYLLFLGSLPLFYSWIKGMIHRPAAILLTLLLAINPLVFKYSSDILSDVPFWAFSMGALFTLWKSHLLFKEKSPNAFGWGSAGILLISACALTRQIGMALVLSSLILFVAQKRWKLLLLSLLLYISTVGVWQGSEHFYRSSHRSDIESLNQQGVQKVLDKSPIKLEYVKHFIVDRPVNMDETRSQLSVGTMTQNIVERWQYYTHTSIDLLFPKLKIKWHHHKFNLSYLWPFVLLFWTLLIPGLRKLFQAFPFAGTYLCLYTGVLLVYPYLSPRFLLPVSPLILLCSYWGLLSLLEHLSGTSSRVQKAVPVVITLFFVCTLSAQLPDTIHWVEAGYKLKIANQGPSLRKNNGAYYQTLLWIKDHTPDNSLIISRKPPVTYFYSHRRATAFPFTAHADVLFNYIREKQQHYGQEYPNIYIFEDHAFIESQRFLSPAIQKYQPYLALIYTDPLTGNRVWRLKDQ